MNGCAQARAGDGGIGFGAQTEIGEFGHGPFDDRFADVQIIGDFDHLQLAGAQAVDDLSEGCDFRALFRRIHQKWRF